MIPWSEDPLGEDGPDASCRGCYRGLWRRTWGWADREGRVICAGAGPAADENVRHEPMPAGLRGSPELDLS